jgi:MFS transporter, DHA1 family, inner membrane transport protein
MEATNENYVNAILTGKKDRATAALWALTLCVFAFGTGECVVAGLLLKIASDLKVSTSSAGLLVSGYAIGVVIGAPLVPPLTRRLNRKTTLLFLMGMVCCGQRTLHTRA